MEATKRQNCSINGEGDCCDGGLSNYISPFCITQRPGGSNPQLKLERSRDAETKVDLPIWKHKAHQPDQESHGFEVCQEEGEDEGDLELSHVGAH